jgi:hypothetical protein
VASQESKSAGDVPVALAGQRETEDSERYQAARTRRARLLGDFVLALRAIWVVNTRDPASPRQLLQNTSDELLESVVAIGLLAEQGIFNAPRRELRFMLEAAVKYAYVDQESPAKAGLRGRSRHLGDTQRVPRSSIEPIKELKLSMLTDPTAFRAAASSAFGALSGYVHPSRPALTERFARVGRGEYSGFETARALEALNRTTAECLDLVIVLLFHGIGPALTGDLFVHWLDEEEDWTFHRTRWVAEVSRFFDYKVERQVRVD